MRENADYGSLLSTLTVILRSRAPIALLCDPAHRPTLPPLPRHQLQAWSMQTILTPIQRFLQVLFLLP